LIHNGFENLMEAKVLRGYLIGYLMKASLRTLARNP